VNEPFPFDEVDRFTTRGAGATVPHEELHAAATELGNVNVVDVDAVTTTWQTLSAVIELLLMQNPLGSDALRPCAADVVTVTVPLLTVIELIETASGFEANSGTTTNRQ
jgi:hypothetical protein